MAHKVTTVKIQHVNIDLMGIAVDTLNQKITPFVKSK